MNFFWTWKFKNMNEAFFGSNIEFTSVNTKLNTGNFIHLVIYITLQEDIQSSIVNLKFIFTRYYIVENISSISILFCDKINFQTINFDWTLEYSHQLWYFFFMIKEVPQTNLFRISYQEFVI